MKTTVFPVAMKHQDHCPPEWQIPRLSSFEDAAARMKQRRHHRRRLIQLVRIASTKTGIRLRSTVVPRPTGPRSTSRLRS